MKEMLRFWHIISVVALALTLAACGGGGDTTGGEATEDDTAGEAAEGEMAEGEAAEGAGEAAEGGAAEGEVTTELSIANQGEQLLFNKDTLGPVPAGEEVSLVFSNDSAVNPHNWILLNTSSDEEAEAFSMEAQQFPAEENHLPPDPELVIASSEFLAAGSSGEDTVTFSVPDPGTYIYVCTVPGHYTAGMHGDLTVVE